MSLQNNLASVQNLIITGNFGSGKTEIALNIAFKLAEKDLDVSLTDLDVINPYFRSREKDEELREAGIDVIFPERLKEADLPVISPEINRALKADDTLAIFDVGGDEEGATALSSIAGNIKNTDYEKWLIVNPLRPRTSSEAKIMDTADRISDRSGLQFTGIVANINLGQETDIELIRNQFPIVTEAAAVLDLPIKYLSVPRNLADKIDSEAYPCSVFPLDLYLNPPGNKIDSG